MSIVSKSFKITARHIELGVVGLLNYRVYTIVPNVSFGLGLGHECDLLCYKDGKFTEVEIKISMADLKKDFTKKHGHKSPYISRLIYAFPETMLEKALPLIPSHCGIIITNVYNEYVRARWYRQCKYQSKDKVPIDKVLKFMSLGCMRIWTLKHHNLPKIRKSDET